MSSRAFRWHQRRPAIGAACIEGKEESWKLERPASSNRRPFFTYLGV